MDLKQIKELIQRMPYCIGHPLSRIPFSWRLGKVYRSMGVLIDQAELQWDENKREKYVIRSFAHAFQRALQFKCYHDLYANAGVLNLKIEKLTDIEKIPIIDKAWTRSHIDEFSGAYRLNTGGSSGEPTAFWMDKECWAREWAHMHTIWARLGYRYTDLKLAIRGRNLGRRPFVYNPVHNEYVINTYMEVGDYSDALLTLLRKRQPRWFHGYPSSIYQFIVECEQAWGVDKTRKTFASVRGLLLSSEYPHPNQVKKFDEYGLKWISWYGHSEMAVLAYGVAQPSSAPFVPRDLDTPKSYEDGLSLVYHPFITYGLAEVVNGHLIGTSYHNMDMPLIRYDTGDLVEKVGNGFMITEGRSGDFITDHNGKRIPLTALIFGRHHHAFDVADHIQIQQDVPGRATLIVSGLKPGAPRDPQSLFDLTNVAVDFDVKFVEKPVRTKAGKLKLKI